MSTWIWSFVALAIVATTGTNAMDDEMAEVARALRLSCIEETGLSEDVIDNVNKGNPLPDDPKLKCYIKCVMESAGMMNDGAVEVENVVAMLPDEMKAKTEPTIRKCGTQKGADDCDTAWKTQVCWQKAEKADYFLV